MKEIKSLVEKLNTYRDSYYNKNESLVSDAEYDAMYDRLESLEKETGIVYANSPTQSVGYEVVGKLKKVKHDHPMLSLAKTTDLGEFADYFDEHDVVVMAKMDGLTASLRYVGGKLVSAESRGNGEIGEDITHTVKTFVNVPLEIPFDGELVVDGECIIDYDTFEEINRRENAQYKNPRNLVSGTVRQLDSGIAAQRNVRFIAWKEQYAKWNNGVVFSPKVVFKRRLNHLKELGFEVVPHVVVSNILKNSIDQVLQECDNLRYPIDGIVGAFDDVEYGNGLGSTGHHPKHSLAFKFYQERNETVLLDIEWNTSRTGLVNPVAVVYPVEIDGTTVSRASLSNVSIIKELELGIGDTLAIIKANQIIPAITENFTRSNTYEIPTVCPSCGEKLELRNDCGRDMIYCVNQNCPAINIGRFANFVSREGMNIDGLSEERLSVMVNGGFVTDFASIYRLKNHRGELTKLDRFGKSSVDNLLAAIEQSRDCELSNVLVAIGIPSIGKSTAKLIANECHKYANGNSFEEFFMLALRNHDWSIIDGVGELTSSGINHYVAEHKDEVRALISELNIAEHDHKGQQQDFLSGKTFCITGKLTHYANRDTLASDIEYFGGKVVSGVTAKTDYLITNDSSSGSSKNQKAVKFGTKIISEKDFMNMVSFCLKDYDS